MRKLSNTIRDYAWGSTTSLAELLGHDAQGDPEAELWIGAHPGAPSELVPEGTGLHEAIAADPEGMLGREVAAEYGRLPYLLKLLAAAQPLSLQVHPDLEQARAGFAAEEDTGPDRGAPNRNYRDDQHKPEMIVALTPFEALSGFRPTAESAPAFEWLAEHVQEPGAANAASGVAAALRAGDLAPATALLLQADDDVRRLAVLGARSVDDAAVAAAEVDHSLELLPRLAAFYPGDSGVLLSLLLHLVRLAPGEAMSLPAGNIHAYLEGTGVEIMANSDNVLRGGLTSKHVDVPELLRIVRFEPLDPHRVVAQTLSPGLEVYRSGFAEFDLARLTATESAVPLPGIGAAEVIVLHGTLVLTAKEGQADGSTLELARGESAFVAGSDLPVMLGGSPDLEAYIAFTDR